MVTSLFHQTNGIYGMFVYLQCKNAIKIYKERKRDKVRYEHFHTGYVIKTNYN